MLAKTTSSQLVQRFMMLGFMLLMTWTSYSQTTVTVRYANGTYDCNTEEYCLDVEFQADEVGQEVYGMNVRFFYDDDILEFVDFRDFQGGYAPFAPDPAIVTTGAPGSGTTLFDFPAGSAAEFVNGAMILDDDTQPAILLPTTGWEKLFSICFTIDEDPIPDFNSFCPSVVWDLEEDPAQGGFLVGDDGVVITLVDPTMTFTSIAAIENVDQYNWDYDGLPGVPYGSPNPTICSDLNNITIAATSTDPTQCGGNGQIELTFTGVDDGTYTINYDGGSFTGVSVTSNSATIDAPAGAYANLGLDINDCSTIESPSVTLTDPTDPVITTVVGTSPTTCPGDEGFITICGLNDGEEYDIDYDKDGSGQATQTATAAAGCVDITGLTAGVYTNFVVTSNLTLCDSDVNTTEITLIDPAGPDLDPITTSDPISCGGDEGSIRICGLTFLTSYDIDYSLGGAAQPTQTAIGDVLGCITLSNLEAGSYTDLIVTNNSNGCISTDAGPHTLTDPDGPTIVSITPNSPLTCGGSTGSLRICGLTPTVPYTINFDLDGTPQTAQVAIADVTGCVSVIGLSAGDYDNILVANNLSGCSTLDPGTYTIEDPEGPMPDPFILNDPVSCGGFEGSIEICGLQAAASYTVAYDKDDNPQVPQIWVGDLGGCITIIGLGAGVYDNFVITNILSTCVTTVPGEYTLSDPAPETIDPVNLTDPTQCGGITGTIELCGLSPAVTYTVNFDKDGSGQLPQILVGDLGGCITLIGLGAGDYTNFEVTNAITTCISTLDGPYTLSDPAGPVLGVITTTDPTTCLGLGGFIEICGLITGRSYSVTYEKDGFPVAVPQVDIGDGSGCIQLLGLGAGSYDNIIVTDVLTACSTPDDGGPHVLNDPEPAIIDEIITTNPTGCGTEDGSIQICGLDAGLFFDVDIEIEGVLTTFANVEVDLGDCILLDNLPVGVYANISLTDLLTGCITTDPGSYELVDNCVYAVNDINNTFLEVPVSGNVLTNDYDTEGDNITINTTPTCDPTNGSVILNGDGSYTYTPDDDFVGTDIFCYEICDDNVEQACSRATVVIEVVEIEDPINNPPVANTDAYVTEENTSVTGDMLANDFDPDGDNLVPVIVPVDLPGNGVVVINLNGTFNYSPFPGFTGRDDFTYTVCDDGLPIKCDTATVRIDVLPDEANTISGVDDAYLGRENEVITGDVSENDTDPEGDNLTYNTTPVQDVVNGSLSLNSDGTFTYTPNVDFIGTDQFIYEVCDDGSPQACDEVTAYLTIRRVCANFELYVYLEGAMAVPDGSGTYNASMRTSLNDLQILPGQTSSDIFLGDHYTPPGQPYSGAPWLYYGTEGTGYDSGGTPGDAGYPETVVDWVYVSIRGGLIFDSEICSFAALLHSDGTVEPIDDCCEINGGDYYVVIEHRNHLIVQSDVEVTMDNGLISYDFRDKDSYIDALGFGQVGQKMIATGVYAMHAANGEQVTSSDADTDITFDDILYWEGENGDISRYRTADYDMNGDVNLNDRRLFELNQGEQSSVDRD